MKNKDILKEVLAISGIVATIIFFGWTLSIGVEKEIKRQEAQTEYMCEYYGHAINKHYGHDVCLTEE